MENFDLLKQGAEARLYVGNYLGRDVIAKERFSKKYRHPDLDAQLTTERIRGEIKGIIRCKMIGLDVPSIYAVDLQTNIIYMEYFRHGITAKEFIFNANDNMIEMLSKDIGNKIAKMHSNNIVHGDLTTSNMLVVNKEERDDFYSTYDKLKLVFIDFGLAHVNASVEDKGVDLYVLERAVDSTHSNADKVFPIILRSYEGSYKTDGKKVMVKFEEVRMRGRKRTMIG